MMKKRDEGYVLAFVLVVIVVLCLVAVSMMSIALQNVRAQTASIERMQDKYIAMARIEKLNAKLGVGVKNSVTALDTEDALRKLLGETGIWVEVTDKSGSGGDGEFTAFSAKVTVTSTYADTQIDCAYTWKGTIEKNDDLYSITTTQWDCTSYGLTVADPTEPEVTP